MADVPNAERVTPTHSQPRSTMNTPETIEHHECYECEEECNDEFQNCEGEIVCEDCALEEADYMTAKYANPNA